MGDKEAQQEEIQSIEAIFGDIVHLESTSRVNLQFEQNVQLTVDLPADYPSRAPPSFELSGPTLKVSERRKLSNQLQNIYMEKIGVPVLFDWIDCLVVYLSERSDDSGLADTSAEDTPSSSGDVSLPEVMVPDIVSGDILVDRKSTFQAHVAAITSEDEAMMVLNKLKENSKIARATHNMYAWRAENTVNGRVIKRHDCEDDGEFGAGPKLLHLLELMKACNVIVVVTRWYGGIHLGPDRFRHICNIARQILVNNGFSNR